MPGTHKNEIKKCSKYRHQKQKGILPEQSCKHGEYTSQSAKFLEISVDRTSQNKSNEQASVPFHSKHAAKKRCRLKRHVIKLLLWKSLILTLAISKNER